MQILPGRNNKATTKWLQLWGQLSLQRRSFLSVWWMQYMSMSKWWSWVCCKKGVQWPDQNATKIRCKLLTSNFSHSGVNLHLPNFTSLSALLWNGKLMYKKYILEMIYLIWFHFDRSIKSYHWGFKNPRSQNILRINRINILLVLFDFRYADKSIGNHFSKNDTKSVKVVNCFSASTFWYSVGCLRTG